MATDEIRWYHGKISREEAECLLNNGEDGKFLVRDSLSSSGDFALSVVRLGQVHHYQIRKHYEDAFFSIDNSIVFHGIENLVNQLRQGGLGALPFPLTSFCIHNEPPPECRVHGRTNLLHRATTQNHETIVHDLLQSGSHCIDARNADGHTALHLTCLQGHEEILMTLLQAGANPNTMDRQGKTPLHLACEVNEPAVIRLLVNWGADPQKKVPSTGWVPLHEAARQGHMECVKALLTQDAACRPRASNGAIPAQLARDNGFLAVSKLLDNIAPRLPKATRREWYHSNINREVAVERLQSWLSTDGTFLVRDSSSGKCEYVLSMVHQGRCFHFQITIKNDKHYIDDGPLLDSLEHLVDHYMRWSDGLPTVLTQPVREPSVQHSQKSKTSALTLLNPLSDVDGGLIPHDWRIQPEHIALTTQIGEGEFSTVFRGSWTCPDGNPMDVAVKKLHGQYSNDKEEFLREARLIMDLEHSCIIRVLGVCLGPPLLMVQELSSLGSMLDYIQENPDKVLSSIDLKVWAAQIAAGMQYLVSKRIIHRDLAARNVLLISEERVKITDFGLTRVLGLGKDYYTSTHGGRWPVKWYAPESVNYGTFSHSSDVWGYGVTLWEMFSLGQQPYGDFSGSQVLELIESGLRLPRPDHASQNVYGIMCRCWAYKPEERPSFGMLRRMFSENKLYPNVTRVMDALKIT